MRESMSGTALFMIVIFFVVLFTGYLCLSINKSRAFSVKNSIIRIIERYGIGKRDARELADEAGFRNDIAFELREVGYNTTHRCPDTECDTHWVPFNTQGQVASSANETVFCVCSVLSSSISASDPNMNPTNKLHYYKVQTFYNFNLQLVGSLMPFSLTIEGTTKPMM